jgi:hypothetical protein
MIASASRISTAVGTGQTRGHVLQMVSVLKGVGQKMLDKDNGKERNTKSHFKEE